MASMLGPHKASSEQWTFPWIKPGDHAIKLLLAAYLRVTIKLVYETHTYSFGTKNYLQSDGGPIGLRVTNPIAKLRIARWIKIVLQYLDDSEINVLLVKSYVDDIRWLLERLEKRVTWSNEAKTLVLDHDVFQSDEQKTNIQKKTKS